MGYLEQYFRQDLAGKCYHSDQEAVDDIRSWIDLCLNVLFDGRDPAAERLDMRGVVITPQEFDMALKDWTLAQRFPGEEEKRMKDALFDEMVQARNYIAGRCEASRQQAFFPRLFCITEEAGISDLETFCFYLALVVEYDRKYERLYGYLQDNVAARLPTVGLGLSIYIKTIRKPDDETDCRIRPDSQLWKLLLKDVPPESGESSLSRPMSVRDNVISYLHGWEDDWRPSQQTIAGAVRVPAVYGWDDLIIEPDQYELLHQICDRVHYREQVMNHWGFEKKSPYGNGVSAIFYGSPGTGKTMAAQVIGKELNRQIYKIDLSQMVSKYIGETEKNLKQLFRAAEENDFILFFDEADSLFAKRSEVTGSNDRYANMETGFLLQQFEEFDGITILATNFINNIDEAFRRRIKFYVKFSFPDPDLRLKLWKSMIPEQAVVEEPLHFVRYAERYELPGSDIREVVTNSAYLAAARGRGICNCDVERALAIHYLKLGKRME